MTHIVAGKLLKIGEVAHKSGLPVKTIRYYEDLGLLSPVVARSESGYRLFQMGVMKRLDFIKRSQALGLKLSEIKLILETYDRGQLPCGEVKQILEGKVQAIAAQIAALEMLQHQLQTLLSDWQEKPPKHRQASTICPNIQSETG
ncbi:heavy metal-responsive transcriptional regulator [Microseira sp. BLCC-F43]|jgi:DNA-binding transcriptional MerR regulator|uniref:heavy metal-responsive transcriptional regulator n=1 Tax=Microseira sp. BLCC-F43 TaxID=3153602 RepID=UPI0035B8EE49